MLYTIYNVETGRIARSGENADIEVVRANLPDGCALHEGEALRDDQWQFVDGAKVPFEPPVDLIALERDLLIEVDQQAEGVRGLFITNTPSQPAVYMAKQQEAEAFMLDQTLSDTIVPNIAREAARLGTSKFAVAVSILTQAEIWRQVSAQIEDIRLGAKDAVRAAPTAAGKRAAAAIDWTPITSLAV